MFCVYDKFIEEYNIKYEKNGKVYLIFDYIL